MPCSYEKHYKPEREICPTVGFQDVTVGVPVEIKPFAQVGKVHTQCLGKPSIGKGKDECEGKSDEICRFTVSQKIRVEVPVMFGAKTEVGKAKVSCKEEGCLCKESKKEDMEKEYKVEEELFRGIIG